MQSKEKRVVLIDASFEDQEEAIAETIELIHACEMELVDVWRQRIKSITNATYLGSGKAVAFAEAIQTENIDEVIFQQQLSSIQAANLEALFQVPVMDRSELIVEIFKRRAHTQEAKLQVRSASLRKQRSRLIGTASALGRQGGGKNKGSGEKQLELDRRILKQQQQECDRQLAELKQHRSIQQEQRKKRDFVSVALVGYTNAGKSTLLNALLAQSDREEHKQVLVKDQLFATLDTALRRIQLPLAPDIICADTVGFVSDLPHELIHAFHATLDEVRHADLLLHVVDAHSDSMISQMKTCEATLKELHADALPRILVYNQCDLSEMTYPSKQENAVYISAKQQIGINLLLEVIATTLFGEKIAITMEIPYEKSAVYGKLKRYFEVETQENGDFGVILHGRMRQKLQNDYVNYVKF